MMNRITFMEIAGKKYPLSFSLGASRAIAKKLGGIDKLDGIFSGNIDEKTIDSLSYILAALMQQGAAYLNRFEADLPPEPGADYANGKYNFLTQEEIEMAVNITDPQLIAAITGCISGSSQTEIDAEVESKNE